MLEETAKFFKEAQIKDLRKNLKDFCKALGQRVPREIDTQLKLAQQIAENGLAIEQETQDLSITELQELIHTVKRASQLRNKEKRLLKFRELIESSIGQAAEGALAMRGKDLLLHFSVKFFLKIDYLAISSNLLSLKTATLTSPGYSHDFSSFLAISKDSFSVSRSFISVELTKTRTSRPA